MIAILSFRFFKWVALLMLAGTTAGAFLPDDHGVRQRMVYGLGTAGLALTWLSGFGLLRTGGWSLSAPWIAGSVVLSVAWLHTLVWTVEKPSRRRPRWAAVAIVQLLLALALMVFRPG